MLESIENIFKVLLGEDLILFGSMGDQAVCKFLRFSVSAGVDFENPDDEDFEEGELCQTAEAAYKTALERFRMHRKSLHQLLILERVTVNLILKTIWSKRAYKL